MDPHEDIYTEQVAISALSVTQGVRVWPTHFTSVFRYGFMLMWVHSLQVSGSAVAELPCGCRGEGKWARSWRARWWAMRTRWLGSAECHLGHAMTPGVSVGTMVGRAPEKLFSDPSRFGAAGVTTSLQSYKAHAGNGTRALAVSVTTGSGVGCASRHRADKVFLQGTKEER